MKLCDFIVSSRRQTNLSQRRMSRSLGLSQPALASVERGDSTPRIVTLIRIGKLLGFQVLVVQGDAIRELHEVDGDVEIAECSVPAVQHQKNAELLSRLSPSELEVASRMLAAVFSGKKLENAHQDDRIRHSRRTSKPRNSPRARLD